MSVIVGAYKRNSAVLVCISRTGLLIGARCFSPRFVDRRLLAERLYISLFTFTFPEHGRLAPGLLYACVFADLDQGPLFSAGIFHFDRVCVITLRPVLGDRPPAVLGCWEGRYLKRVAFPGPGFFGGFGGAPSGAAVSGESIVTSSGPP